jgi:hypothetical protein
VNGDAVGILMKPDIKETGDGSLRPVARMSVCGLGKTVVGDCWVEVIIEVWRESRLNGLAGIGDISGNGNVVGGSGDNNNNDTITFIRVI